MGDLVRRLLDRAEYNFGSCICDLCAEQCVRCKDAAVQTEAADAIESLTARLAEAEEALRGNAAFIKAQAEERARIEAALERIAETDLLEIAGYHTRKWCIPETGSEYESREPVFKRSAFQNAQDFQKIARAALATQENTNAA